jgi:hypothetical protein
MTYKTVINRVILLLKLSQVFQNIQYKTFGNAYYLLFIMKTVIILLIFQNAEDQDRKISKHKLSKIFGLKKNKVGKQFWILNNEELCDQYVPCSIVMTVKSRRL